MSSRIPTLTVDILKPLADAAEPRFLEAATVGLEERMILASFVDAKLVSGVYRRDEMGRPSDFADLVITLEWRRHLADAERELRDQTSVGYVRNRAPKIIAWFFTILASVLAGWIAKSYFP